ncbi:MAG TPA: hypothetical protein DD670_05630, partial [Planctomycetaceae bacterium]|nr:hypothetical protein [Planctomycetaceae bacterium]
MSQAQRGERADAVMQEMVAKAGTAEALFESYLYKEAHQLPEAKADLEAALALEPENIPLLLAAARARQREGFGEEARVLLARIMELDPTNPASYLGLARLAVSQDRPEEALELCQAGLAKLPANDIRRLWLLRLAAETRLDMQRLARVAPDAAPTEAEARLASEKEVGEALAAHAAAIQDLRPLVIALREQQPEGGMPTMSVIERGHSLLQARWLLFTGKPDEAKPILEQVASGRDDTREEIDQSVQAFHLLGAVHATRGEWDRAADALEQAVALVPESLLLRLAAGDACGRAKRFDKALGHCRQALAMAANDVTRVAYARAVLQQEAARPVGQRDLPRALDALAQEGTILSIIESAAAERGGAVLGDLEQAFGTLEGPEKRHAVYCKARRLLATSTSAEEPAFAEAEQLETELERLAPDWPPTSLLRGLIHERTGRFDEAAVAYEKALADGGDQRLLVERLLPALSRAGRFEELDGHLARREADIADSAALAPLAILRRVARGETDEAIALAR